MDFSQQDIDGMLRAFRDQPNQDDYFTIKDWYENNQQMFYDQEYVICVYLFLLGANIRHRFEEFSHLQHKRWIKEIRDTIETADHLHKATRLAYLECGTKSGYYH